MRPALGTLHRRQRSVIVAVSIVTMVHVPGNDIIRVGGMRYGFVTAVFFVFVAALVRGARVSVRTSFRINRRCFNNVFVDVSVVYEVEMAVVQIIGMSGVPDLRMGACRPVLVRVPAVRCVFHTGKYTLNREHPDGFSPAGAHAPKTELKLAEESSSRLRSASC
jgi:hypothetical protein